MAKNGKKVVRIMKIQFPAGGAKPGPALAGAGIQMPKFCTAFNDQTKDRHGETVPVVLTVYEDKSFDFVLKSKEISESEKRQFLFENAKGFYNFTDFDEILPVKNML